MKRPIESDYTSLVAYTRALEEYCDALAQPEHEPVGWQYVVQLLVAAGHVTQEKVDQACKLEKAQPAQEPVCDKDPQGCWNVRCQLGKKCKNTPPAAQPAQLPYSVQQAYAMAQVCLDLHEALGCKWGDNVYLTISQLKAAHGIKEKNT